MRVYATPDDYTDWLKPLPAPEPDEATRQLRDASLIVDGMLFGAVYDVDEQGMPTKPTVRDAIRDATCAQAAYTAETGDEHGTGGYEEVQARSVRLRRSASGRAAAQPQESPNAERILRAEGLVCSVEQS